MNISRSIELGDGRASAPRTGREMARGNYGVASVVRVVFGFPVPHEFEQHCDRLFALLVPQNLADECATHIVPVIKHAVEDRSWRVRCAMARGFSRAAEAVGPKLTTVELLPSLIRCVPGVVKITLQPSITFSPPRR